jgi:putative nucleotidyltransferase with HDIG domain
MSLLLLSPYLLSLLIVMSLEVYSFSSGRGLAIRAFGWMCHFEVLWISLFLAEQSLLDLSSRLIMDSLRLTAMFGIPISFLALAYSLGMRGNILKARGFWSLLVPPAVFILILALEGGLGLMRRSPALEASGMGLQLSYGIGPLLWAAYAYCAVLVLVGLVLIGLGPQRREERGPKLLLVLIVAAVLPAPAVFRAFLAPDWLPYRDVSVLAMGLGSALLAWPLARVRLFDNLPYVESLAFNELPDAALIFDARETLVGANRAGRYLFGLGPVPYGRAASAAFVDGLNGLRAELEGEGGSFEICLKLGDSDRDYAAQVSPIYRHGKRIAAIASFTDVTSLNNAGRALRNMRDGLEAMVRERTADLQSEVERRREAEGLLILLNEELRSTQKEIMLTLSEIVENRSKETANHVLRVAQYAYIIALAAGVPEERASMIRDAAPLHDIGKVAIPDRILNKPAGLEDEEWAVMRTHTEIGYDILKSSQRDLLKVAAVIAREHHERWDGTGYPRGLKGEEISLEGRVVALADVVDALFSRRIYKEPWDLERIAAFVQEESGRHFQPLLAQAFMSQLAAVRAVTERYPDAVSRSVRL